MANLATLSRPIERSRLAWRGLALCVMVALAAAFVSAHYGGPPLIYALFFGISLNFLYEQPAATVGIDLCTSTVLRWGVALLGARITLTQIGSLGADSVILIVACVAIVIAASMLLAPRFGLNRAEGALAGGAVAICGASAAVAIAAVVSEKRMRPQFLLFVVIGVTAMSTFAMIVYPIIATALELRTRATGLFLGGSIHDVAQVVGAGYLISDAVGDTAIVVKLLRVSLLAPTVMVLGVLFVDRGADVGLGRNASILARGRRSLPWFLVMFVCIAAANSLSWIPMGVAGAINDASRWCVLIAIAALGIKTSPAKLAKVGWAPVASITVSTVLLLLLMLGAAILGV